MGDDRPEIERYRREGLGGQLLGELRELRRHPGILTLIVVVIGGFAFLRVTTPQTERIERLRTGDCIYVRAADADTLGSRPVGSPGEVAAALNRDGAERASCDLSHSHEVADIVAFPEVLGTPYPGTQALIERERPRCEAAFAALVGRPVAGSAFELTIVVPPQAGWDQGRRAGLCLVGRADGGFLQRRAAGSGG